MISNANWQGTSRSHFRQAFPRTILGLCGRMSSWLKISEGLQWQYSVMHFKKYVVILRNTLRNKFLETRLAPKREGFNIVARIDRSKCVGRISVIVYTGNFGVMASRHLQGTVFKRVKELLATGVLRNKPIWFDVMSAFPPITEAKLSDIAEEGRPPVIHFKEDDIRDAFLERFPILYKLPINLLQDEDSGKMRSVDFPSLSTLVKKYKEFMKVQNDSEVAMEKTIGWVLSEMEDVKIKRSWDRQVKNLKKQERELGNVDNDATQSDDAIDISELFKLSIKGSEKSTK